jgi:hypothetical protein
MNEVWVWSCDGNTVTSRFKVLWVKPAPVPLRPSQKPHGQARNRKWASASRRRQQTAWDMAPPYSIRKYILRRSYVNVRLQVLTTVTAHNTIVWEVTTYSLAEIYRRFGGTFYLHFQGISTLLHIGKFLPDCHIPDVSILQCVRMCRVTGYMKIWLLAFGPALI